MEIWHKRIKALRENTDVTLKDMANIIGVSEATVQRYECGKILELPYKVIIAYAEKFNVPPSYIMGWDDEPTIEPIIPDNEGLTKRIMAYAKGLPTLFNYASQLNEQGIEELTKHAKLMSNSEDYRKEDIK